MLDYIRTNFSNRELATAIWFAVFAISAAPSKDVRKSAARLGKAALHPKILTILGTTAGYVGLILAALRHVGYWYESIAKDAAVWTLFSGLALISWALNSTDVPQKSFGALVRKAVSATVLVEFLVGFYSFSIKVELLLVPVSAVIACFDLIGKSKEGPKIARKAARGLQTIGGLALLTYTAIEIASSPNELFKLSSLQQLGLPVLLTVAFVPFLYAYALISTYEQLFMRLEHAFRWDSALTRLFKRHVLRRCGINLTALQTLASKLSLEIWRADSKEDALRLLATIDTR